MINLQANTRNFLTETLKAHYAADVVTMRLLAHGDKWVFRVQRTDGADWVLRAVPPDAAGSYADICLRNALATLRYLENQSYCAERIVRTPAGNDIAESDGWRLLITTYLGSSLQPWRPASSGMIVTENIINFANSPASIGDLQALGAILGQLHCIPTDGAPPLPHAVTLPRRDLAWVADYLASVAAQVPSALQIEYQELMTAVQTTDHCEGLPTVLLHNDCAPGNVVRTSSGQIALVDWDGAGLGPAVIDVGSLLSACFTDEFRPDEQAIRAIVEGYCRYRTLSEAETRRLLDALRFRTLVLLGGYFLEWASGSLPDDERAYGMTYPQWQAKYTVAEEIAVLAIQYTSNYVYKKSTTFLFIRVIPGPTGRSG